MEDFPRVPSHEAPSDDQDKKKKRKKSASEQEKPATRELSAREKALANLAVKKREQAESDKSTAEAKDAKKKTPEEGEASATASGATEHESDLEASSEIETEEAEKDELEEEYKPLPEYIPPPGALNLAEAIDLSRSDEVVVLLRSDDTGETEQEHAEDKEPTEADQSIEMPVFTAQPEEQHQARDEEPESPEPTPAAAGGGEVPPTIPPEIPVPSFEQPPEPARVPMNTEYIRPEPAQAYREYMERQAAQEVPANERPATKQEMEDALYYATKTGQNKGVLTGLLVGGAYEHFKHKRREKRAGKRFQTQGKQLESARQSYNFGLEEQAKRQAETELRFNAAERRFESAEKRFQNRPAAEKQPVRTPEQVTAAAAPEQLNIPPEHRLETSAWHSIEVDAKTGKPVETPTFQYGKEYYRERAQETGLVQQRNAAAGEVALVAAAGGVQGGGSAASDDGSLPPVQIPSATRQGPPSSKSQLPQQSSGSTVPEPSDSSAPLWPWLLALVVVAICLIFVAVG